MRLAERHAYEKGLSKKRVNEVAVYLLSFALDVLEANNLQHETNSNNRIIGEEIESYIAGLEDAQQQPSECINCDEAKEVHEICSDCLVKIVKENQTGQPTQDVEAILYELLEKYDRKGYNKKHIVDRINLEINAKAKQKAALIELMKLDEQPSQGLSGAVEEASKDVRKPKCVRDGLVQPTQDVEAMVTNDYSEQKKQLIDCLAQFNTNQEKVSETLFNIYPSEMNAIVRLLKNQQSE